MHHKMESLYPKNTNPNELSTKKLENKKSTTHYESVKELMINQSESYNVLKKALTQSSKQMTGHDLNIVSNLIHDVYKIDAKIRQCIAQNNSDTTNSTSLLLEISDLTFFDHLLSGADASILNDYIDKSNKLLVSIL
jgi:hypothetical protein